MLLSKKCYLILLISFSVVFGQEIELLQSLQKVTNFALKHHEEINFDSLLGYIIAEAQIRQCLKVADNKMVTANLVQLLQKLERIKKIVLPMLPKFPPKMQTLQKYLLQPSNWITNETWKQNKLKKLKTYEWSIVDIVGDKSAFYKGVPSDFCLMEILAQNCYIGPFCEEMMLAPRIDKGYLLSHRLFYLQIVRLKKCAYNKRRFGALSKKYCTLMWREARTNIKLDLPAHDIFLEQIVLCGIEGFTEFVSEKWRNVIMMLQTKYGCYTSGKIINSKRSSNVISYGCSDHTTGLAAAALALNLKFLLEEEIPHQDK